MSGVGLDTAFNQDEPQQNINTHAKQDKQAEGLEDERKDKKKLNLERIQHAKVGETVSYNATTGTIVRKDGSYVTIYNEGNNAFDQVHAGTTSISTDTIGSGITGQLWDQMRQEQRVASLSKAGIQEPLHFINRKWSELPMNLKDVLKVNPTSRGEPGEKMPGTASNTGNRGTLKPGGRTSTGGQGSRLNSGQERKFKPGNKVPVKVDGKTIMVTERQRDKINAKNGQETPVKTTPTTTTPPTTTPPTEKSPSYTSVGSGYKGTVPEGASRDKPSQPRYGTTTGQTRGPGQTASTTDKITNKPSGNVRASGSGPGGPTGASSRSARGSRAADRASTRSTSSGSNTPRQPEGVTFATGLDKATNYSDLATALYRIRNNLNKVKLPDSITSQVKFPRDHLGEPDDKESQNPRSNEHNSHNTDSGGELGSKDSFKIKVESSTPKGPGFGKIEGTGGKPTAAVAPPGGTKFFSDSGKGPFKSQEEADASAPRKQRNISAERTARNEYNAKPGQTVANRLSENKSDPEHGAYGGVVTDTPFDAPEDYEEDREDVHGKEFDHNHQQKTPKDFGVPQAKDTKKEGGSVTTGTPGTNNPVNSGKKQPGAYDPKYDPDEDGYRGKAIVNKSNTRYGPRQVTKEEAMEIWKKSGKLPGTPGTGGVSHWSGYNRDYENDGSDPVVGSIENQGGKQNQHSSFQAASTHARGIENANPNDHDEHDPSKWQQVSSEDRSKISEANRRKAGIKPSKPKLDTNLLDHGGDYVEESEDGPHGGRNRDFAED